MVGILGRAFTAESDGIWSSLRYRLKRLVALKVKRAPWTDPYVAVAESGASRAGSPGIRPAGHRAAPRRLLSNRDQPPVVDLTDLRGRGSRMRATLGSRS